MADAVRSRTRVAIVDDHAIFRDGLRRLLESEAGFDVVAEAANGEDALRIARDIKPDVLLLDVAMPRMGGIEALAAMETNSSKVVLLTAGLEPSELLRALQLGARGVVLKEAATQTLIDGIYRVVAGEIVIGGGVAKDLAQAVAQIGAAANPRDGLTSRELEIVVAVVGGNSNRDIASKLGISLQTVKHHLTNIFDKTGASSRLELALMALRRGLVDAD